MALCQINPRLILQHVMHNESQAHTLCSVSVTGTSKKAEQCAHPWRSWDKEPSAKQQLLLSFDGSIQTMPAQIIFSVHGSWLSANHGMLN
ncbi:uncharacterized protein TRIVIDRAFT_217724 [Trichoderma virens Gv29-8]|uniref:Uncharacterized protein n=1 Tax=Hypocrea virens (strain Gv29-8 / FGSC 10586) TaxID=413071 RepID=G9MFG3_HYPVG|nr:uncharacterized protein TRIVIDRAFT_217724 [Trichoderma virens Gv29-8]EHK27129.1 hypothetical protein TRIVIDRAFT_217724 [Trichoderma virens Gv29-8]